MWGAGHLCGRRRTSRTLRLNHKTLEHLLNLLVPAVTLCVSGRSHCGAPHARPSHHFVRIGSRALWHSAHGHIPHPSRYPLVTLHGAGHILLSLGQHPVSLCMRSF